MEDISLTPTLSLDQEVFLLEEYNCKIYLVAKYPDVGQVHNIVKHTVTEIRIDSTGVRYLLDNNEDKEYIDSELYKTWGEARAAECERLKEIADYVHDAIYERIESMIGWKP